MTHPPGDIGVKVKLLKLQRLWAVVPPRTFRAVTPRVWESYVAEPDSRPEANALRITHAGLAESPLLRRERYLDRIDL